MASAASRRKTLRELSLYPPASAVRAATVTSANSFTATPRLLLTFTGSRISTTGSWMKPPQFDATALA
ncbi:hypothetical protein D3C72_2494060 [compost metagenome]